MPYRCLMSEVLKITNRLSIPLNEIEFSAMRAQGPGGQAVNKTSSALHIRFDFKNSPSLTEGQKERIAKFRDSHITASGFVLIKAQSHRVQERNREDGLKRLQSVLSKALYVEPKRRATRPTWGATKRRLKKKNERGQTKALRGKVRRADMD